MKISDRVWRQLTARLEEAGRMRVRVGVFSQERHTGGDLTMVELAAVHEFGSPAAGVPERSFIRRTFDEQRPELAKITTALATAVVRGLPARVAMSRLGAWGAAAVRRTITDGAGVPPPNAPSTVARKHSARPLVDTGQLLNSVTHVVVD